MEEPMADEATTETPVNGAEGESQDSLGEPGKKALDAERRRANAAEKALKAMQSRLDELENEKLSKEDKAEKRALEAEKRATEAEASALRWRIAAKHGISDEDAELFLTGLDEATLTRQAERLAARIKAEQPEGLFVPAEGRQPSPPALNSDDLESALKAKLGIA
jgi:TolA-binding protein